MVFRSALGASIVVLVSAASACASGPVDGGSASSVDVAAAERALNTLTDKIFGNPAERRAGEILVYHAVQDPLKECMKLGGLAYTEPGYVDIYSGVSAFPIPDGVGRWTASLSTERVGSGVTSAAERARAVEVDTTNPSYTSLSPAERARYDKALEVCSRQQADTGVNFPAMTPVLDTALAKFISKIE